MAQEYSFDVVSQFDAQELLNAVDQTRREISTRFDFKGVAAEIESGPRELTILAESDYKLKAIVEVLTARMVKRGLSPKILDLGEPQAAARGNVRQVIKLRQGIGEDLARDLVKRIRGIAPRVQPRIQGDALRVSSRDKDQLQAVISGLRALELPTPLQFINYR
ncbi:MAG TPA: YajQ family cyclic di-GMP-binding protein [Dehalococcoidia bacterium]|nr:YajQ family cyclic di-GMP-binding protein [Dehalococcoidia bacterium]